MGLKEAIKNIIFIVGALYFSIMMGLAPISMIVFIVIVYLYFAKSKVKEKKIETVDEMVERILKDKYA